MARLQAAVDQESTKLSLLQLGGCLDTPSLHTIVAAGSNLKPDKVNAMSRDQLHFQQISCSKATSTILFVHGATSSGQEWDLVTPHLQDAYHILLPDLPHHGGSSDVKPFTIDTSVNLLADLIRQHALGGKAHVVGFSLGANVTVALVSRFPNLAETVFVSGYGTLPDVSQETLAKGLWLESRIDCIIPRSWITWGMDGADLSFLSKPSLQLCREIASPATNHKRTETQPWSARTLIVAAGKKDWLPTADSLVAARWLRDSLLAAQDGKTKAVTHPELRHPWGRQRPAFFAQAVKSWIEESRVVNGFMEL